MKSGNSFLLWKSFICNSGCPVLVSIPGSSCQRDKGELLSPHEDKEKKGHKKVTLPNLAKDNGHAFHELHGTLCPGTTLYFQSFPIAGVQ